LASGFSPISSNPLFEPFDLGFGLAFVLLERGLQLFALCRLRHFRQRNQDFGKLDALQCVME
jgi:hypothetical protein